MSLTVVLSVKQPRSDCSQTVKTYGTKTTELSQWTVIKASLKTLIGFYKITPPCILCMLVSVLVFQIWWNVCVHVSQSTIPFVFVHFCVFSCVHVFSTFWNNLFSALCLSFYPHTISLLPTLLVFPQIDNSHPIIPHFTLSFPSLNSICVCLWLLYSMLNFWKRKRFESVYYSNQPIFKTNICLSYHTVTCCWSQSNWTLNINPPHLCS